jgi:hypothetical protein
LIGLITHCNNVDWASSFSSLVLLTPRGNDISDVRTYINYLSVVAHTGSMVLNDVVRTFPLWESCERLAYRYLNSFLSLTDGNGLVL